AVAHPVGRRALGGGLQRDRRPGPRAADHARPGPRGPREGERRMNRFEWLNPTSVKEAVAMLKPSDARGDVDEAPRPLAGGQDLLTTMKDYLTRPSRLVNLKGIRGLDRIEGDARQGLK